MSVCGPQGPVFTHGGEAAVGITDSKASFNLRDCVNTDSDTEWCEWWGKGQVRRCLRVRIASDSWMMLRW